MHYSDASGRIPLRIVRPLGCFYWGKVWTLAAWREARDGTFQDEAGKRLTGYLRSTESATDWPVRKFVAAMEAADSVVG